MKFRLMAHIDPLHPISRQNFELVKIQYGGHKPSWKLLSCYISATV